MNDPRSSVPEVLDDSDLIELNVPLGPLRHGAVSGYAPAGSTEQMEVQELSLRDMEEFGSGARALPTARGGAPVLPSDEHDTELQYELIPDLTMPAPIGLDRELAELPPLRLSSTESTTDRRGFWITLVLLAAVAMGAALGFYVRSKRDAIQTPPSAVVVQQLPAVMIPVPEPAVAPSEPVATPEEQSAKGEIEAAPELTAPPVATKPKAAPRRLAAKPVQMPASPRRAAASSKPAPPAAKPEVVAEVVAPQPPLPEALSRAQVLAGFESVRSAVASCASGQYGVARVTATVQGSGLVTYSVVAGDFQGTPAGSCIARAVRKARFPAFSGSPFTVEFPYSM